jgi:hypothetical protein
LNLKRLTSYLHDAGGWHSLQLSLSLSCGPFCSSSASQSPLQFSLSQHYLPANARQTITTSTQHRKNSSQTALIRRFAPAAISRTPPAFLGNADAMNSRSGSPQASSFHHFAQTEGFARTKEVGVARWYQPGTHAS